MTLVLNPTLRLNYLVRAVRMNAVTMVAAHLEMHSMQEGPIDFVKFMGMKMTVDFHFWIAYLRRNLFT